MTTTVLFFLALSYLPIIVVRILLVNNVIKSVNLAYITYFTAGFATVFNSFINPIIYCVRMRQFRVAFIEILFRKGKAQAEDIELRVCGKLNSVSPLEEG